MNDDFVPREAVNDTLRYWWLVVIMMLIGSICGWLFHLFRPPIYEACSTLSATIDYTHTGQLSELEQDRALEIVGDVTFSTQVVKRVVHQAQQEGVDIDEQSFIQIAYRERKSHAYQLRVRNEDAYTAALLTNIWAKEALDVLNNALSHATAAEQLQSGADALSSCLQAVVTEPVHAYCNIDNLDEIQSQMLETGQMIFNEKKESLGIFAGLTFAWTDEAFTPSSPRLYKRNLMIFSGAFMGFVIAVWIIALRIPKRLISQFNSSK